MYIYDRIPSGTQSRSTGQSITSRPAQRNSYYPDRVISGFLGRGGSSSSYVWTSEGLGEVCISPGVSRNDPTALNLSPVGTADFNVMMDVRRTRYQVKGNVFYPGQSSGARVPFNTSAVAEGKAPIVFIAHGQHATFYNPDPRKRADECGYNTDDCSGFLPIANHKGYEYFQQLLARMGIISVSVDCNQFSGNVGLSQTGINGSADLVLGAIKHFQSLHSGRAPIFGGHVDFSSVGLMGHSRGGEAVLLAPELLALPSTGISGVTVKGVLAIAPTDTDATSGTRTGFAFMTILPAADLDLFANEGARFYDRASADPFKCQLYVHDANHNFFNEEWVSDDRDTWNIRTATVTRRRSHITLMSKDEQKAILKAYGCAFFRAVLQGHKRRLAGHQMRKFLEGLEISPRVTRFRDVHISFECFESFERRRSTTVDDNESPDIRRNTRGQTNTWAGGLTAQRCEFAQTGCRLAKTGRAITINKTFYGKTRGMVARSSLKSGRFKWVLGGTMDLSGREIRIRAAEVYDGSSVPVGATGFKLGLADARDKRGFVDSDDVGGLPRPYDRSADDLAIFGSDFTKTMLKTLRFPISCIVARAEPGFDATKVRAIVLWMDRNDGRELAFDQLQIV
jgi:hypothetical protein